MVQDPTSLRLTVDALRDQHKEQPISAVAGMEARCFIFGSIVAWRLGV